MATDQVAASPPAAVEAKHGQHRQWVSAWQGSPVRGATFDNKTCPSDVGLDNQTVRNVVRVAAGGQQIRVRVSNTYGEKPLRIGRSSVAIATGSGAGIERGTGTPIRFSGRRTALVPVGGTLVSDPITFRVRAQQKLAISLYLPEPTGPATQHYFATQDSYLAAGSRSGSGSAPDRTKITCWLFASGVDVLAGPRVRGTVVTLGDSITDGYGSSQNLDRRYPDQLARRLAARKGGTLSVSNAGIGGNTILAERTDFTMFGDTASARFDRDVLSQPGVTDVILLEGINDIGANSANARDLIEAQRAVISQARAAGLRIYGATLTPFGGSDGGGDYGTAYGERQRQALNRWIRTSGEFDAVFDFDRAVRDPANPTRMRAAYDSGDHLHPNDAGYAAMAAVVDLDRLLRD
ncbi:MAG: SGNH/GDSL hydrolase family protein [Microlunatus sp.]